MQKDDTSPVLLHKYDAPTWAAGLKNIPRHFVKLAQRNTPLTEWNLVDIPNGFKIGIKRDDMTGSTLSGSKVRKLEFILADAIALKCDSVVTQGTWFSNHCRATAIAAKQVGLKCHLFLRIKDSNCNGNKTLIKLTGSDIIEMKYCTPIEMIERRMKEFAEKLGNSKTSSAYVIPSGGSSYIGMFGYIQCFEEIMQQNALENYTDIFVTCGSTGTASALAIGNYLTGSKLKIHAVSVSRQVAHVYETIQKKLNMAGLEHLQSQDIVDVMLPYDDRGYGVSTKEEIDFIGEVASTTGIILGPFYTAKTARRMLVEMKNNPSRFKGKRVLFIHTGGVFGVFSDDFTTFWNVL